MFFCLSLFLSLSLSLVCVYEVRKVPSSYRQPLVEEDSYCRGGIVHIRGGRSRARLIRPKSPTALWRFRASTSNSPSDLLGRKLTRISVILIILTLNKIFEYVKMTTSSRP